MAVRSSVLWYPTLLTPASTHMLVYTVPTGVRTILKYLTVVSTATCLVQVNVLKSGEVSGNRYVYLASPVGIQDHSRHVWVVLDAGDKVRIWSNTNNAVTVGGSGAELVL